MAEDKDIFKRLQIFFIITVFLCVALVGRLAQLQIYQGDQYETISEENRIRRINIQPPRGEIYSRDGKTMAKNTPGYTVSLMDVEQEDKEHIVDFLSEYLDLSEDYIEERIRSQRYRQFEPVQLKSGLTYEQVAHIMEKRMELPGVIIETQPEREYPQDKIMSHILGYTGEVTQQQLEGGLREEGYRAGDMVGQSGVEKTYEDYLRGESGVRQVEVNRFGRIIENLGEEEPVPGKNLHLTIDYELQAFMVDLLDTAIEEIREEEDFAEDYPGGASSVIMDPSNGEILSMVSLPKYNPNTFFEDYTDLVQDRLRPLKNRAVSETYPPGSTYKMLTAIAALEEGVVTPGETIIDEGQYWNPPHPTNFQERALGRINIVDAIKYSSNVFFSEMGHRMGIENMVKWSEAFTLGTRTGLEDLSGEHRGIVASPEYKMRVYQEPENQVWFPGETIIAAMGQGYHTFTPLQKANYAAILANQGKHYRPYLVSEITDHQGEVTENRDSEVLNNIEVSDRTWQTVHQGMRQVGTLGGTAGWHFHDLPFELGLKTGTAEVDGAPSHSWMVGFAPFEEPEIAFSIFIENGGGSSNAVPVARTMIDYYFDLIEEEAEEVDEAFEIEDHEGYVDE